MPNVQFISLCLVLTFVNVVPIVAQAPPSKTSIPEEAQQRLDHMVGRWNLKTDFLSRNGDVRRTVHGTEEAKYIIEGRVVELTTTLPEQNIHSKGWLFYNSSEQQFYLTSVDNNGDHWILSGGLDLYQITSQPKNSPPAVNSSSGSLTKTSRKTPSKPSWKQVSMEVNPGGRVTNNT